MSRTNHAKQLARAPHKATRKIVANYGRPLAKALYNEFARTNRAYFGSKLGAPMILITEPGGPRALGDFIGRDVHGIESRIRIAPSSAERGEKFAFDVLLHEMIHAWQTEVLFETEANANGKEIGYRGHGPRFAEQCNKIGAKLGLPPVGVKGRDGLPDCAHWPMNVRPDGYYPAPWEPAKRRASKPAGSGESDDEGKTKTGTADALGIIVDGARVDRALDTIVSKVALLLGVRRSDVVTQAIVGMLRATEGAKAKPKTDRVKATRVAKWEDQSGNGNHAQLSPKTAPSLREAALASARHQNPDYKRSPAFEAHCKASDDLLGQDPSPEQGTANDGDPT